MTSESDSNSDQHSNKRRKTQARDSADSADSKSSSENKKNHLEPPFHVWLHPHEEHSALPAIFDLELLHDLWLNKFKDDAGDDVLHPRFKQLTSRGDVQIAVFARDILIDLFGRSNYNLLSEVYDHCKSNILFNVVAKHYEMEVWTKYEPRKLKDWADILEAWMGAVLEDHGTWNEFAPLCELKQFMRDIWRVRYRKLEQYGMQLRTKLMPAIEKHQTLSSEKIFYPTDELIKNVLYPQNHLRRTRWGWLYKFNDENEGIEITAFSQKSDKDALDSLIEIKAIRQKFPESHPISGIKTSSTVNQIRSKWFESLKQKIIFGNRESLFAQIITLFSENYAIWLNDPALKTISESDREQLEILLIWNRVSPLSFIIPSSFIFCKLTDDQSFIYFQNSKYRQCFMDVISVLKYAIQNMPRTRKLAMRVLERLKLIFRATKNDSNYYDVHVNLQDGKVSQPEIYLMIDCMEREKN